MFHMVPSRHGLRVYNLFISLKHVLLATLGQVSLKKLNTIWYGGKTGGFSEMEWFTITFT